MRYHDNARPRLVNGRMCWESSPMVALPMVHFEPLEGDVGGEIEWNAVVIVDGSWVEKRVRLTDMMPLLIDWEVSPEETLVKWFGVEPPQVRVRQQREETVAASPAIETEASLDDLGL